jgi:superoxide dismutase, Cu-Zn family
MTMNLRSVAPLLAGAALLITAAVGAAGEVDRDQTAERSQRTSAGDVMTADIKPHSPPIETMVEAIAVDAEGSEVGGVTLVQLEHGVAVNVRFRDLEPGFAAVRVHESGVCEGDDPAGPFSSAGDRYTAGEDEQAGHAGELPSLLVMADGTAEATVVTDRFTLEQLIVDGTTVIVYQGSGDSAQRVACAVIEMPDDKPVDDTANDV